MCYLLKTKEKKPKPKPSLNEALIITKSAITSVDKLIHKDKNVLSRLSISNESLC